MVILGGGGGLMSEVTLYGIDYEWFAPESAVKCRGTLQGYLAHKKHPPPRTLQ